MIFSPYIDVCFQFSLVTVEGSSFACETVNLTSGIMTRVILGLHVAYLCFISVQCVLLGSCEITWIPRNHLWFRVWYRQETLTKLTRSPQDGWKFTLTEKDVDMPL